jgi:hypothetical protein
MAGGKEVKEWWSGRGRRGRRREEREIKKKRPELTR